MFGLCEERGISWIFASDFWLKFSFKKICKFELNSYLGGVSFV